MWCKLAKRSSITTRTSSKLHYLCKNLREQTFLDLFDYVQSMAEKSDIE